MAYIDKAYFGTYTTTEIDDAEFGVLAERASDIIDMITFDRISKAGGINNLSAFVQGKVKKAVAAQTESLYLNGGIEAAIGGATVTSASIGKFSYGTGGTGGAGAAPTINGVVLHPLVYAYLSGTGLAYRGLDND